MSEEKDIGSGRRAKPGAPVDRAALVAELKNNLRVGLLTGSIGGVLLGFLYAAATLVLNPGLLRSARDVMVLVFGLVLVYAFFCVTLGLIGALGKTALFRSTGRHFSDTKTAAFVTGAIFFSIGALYGYQWCRWHRIGGLSPETQPGLEQLPIILTVLAVAALLARLLTYAFYLLIVHFKKPERARPGDLRKAFLVLAYMAAAFGIFVLALRLGSPEAGASGGLTQDQIHALDAPLRILAIDGLGADDIARLRNSDSLAPLGSLFRGREADVPVHENPVAPVTWTRVATGRPLEAHGIVDYQAQVVRGLSKPFTVTANQVGLFQLFQDVLPFFRLTRPVPMRSYMRGSKGIWNIAADAGRSAVVVNWWVSYPAERIRGAVVSDHTYLRLVSELGGAGGRDIPTHELLPDRLRGIRPQSETYPGSLLLELAPMLHVDSTNTSVVSQAQSRLEALGLPRDVLAADLFYARSALYLLERDHPELWLLHLPGPDVFRRLLRRDVEDPNTRRRAFDEALDAYWSVLGPTLAPLGSATDARTAWLSLPGWPLDSESEPQVGQLFLSGPAVGSQRIAPIPLDDLCPTFLWLLGLPYSGEMMGAPRADVVQSTERLGEPRRIAGFGPLVTPADAPSIDPTTDRARLELLRSLGYIDN